MRLSISSAFASFRLSAVMNTSLGNVQTAKRLETGSDSPDPLFILPSHKGHLNNSEQWLRCHVQRTGYNCRIVRDFPRDCESSEGQDPGSINPALNRTVDSLESNYARVNCSRINQWLPRGDAGRSRGMWL